jgi:hypothetical protein
MATLWNILWKQHTCLNEVVQNGSGQHHVVTCGPVLLGERGQMSGKGEQAMAPCIVSSADLPMERECNSAGG